MLTNKQKSFISEYLIDKNAVQAAIRAGYSKRTADKQGSQLLGKTRIKAEIDKKLAELNEKALVSAEYVIKGFKEVAERCMKHEPEMVWDKENKCLVNAIDEETGKILYKFDSMGANKSLEMLGRHLNIFKNDKSESNIQVIITDERTGKTSTITS